jgi:hypothetical protein
MFYSVDRRRFYQTGGTLDLWQQDPLGRPFWRLPDWFEAEELRAHVAELFRTGSRCTAGNTWSRPPKHVAPCVRLRLGQCRPRHSRIASVPRAQEHPAHGEVQRACSRSVKEFLAVTPRPCFLGREALAGRVGSTGSAEGVPSGGLRRASRAAGS